MPYTVTYSFEKFIENISLTGDHNDTAAARKGHLVSLLADHFQILEAFPTGSIPRGTALKGAADLDVMVALHYGKHIKDKTCAQVLADVQKALSKYRTNVRRNGQAVTLYYESWPDVDVVPVLVTYNSDNSVNHYNVPDMNTDRWLVSRPRRHGTAIEQKAQSCGAGFKHLIKMVKEWNRRHSELLSSFHIEVLALQICESVISDYPWAVCYFFQQAAKLIAKPLVYDGNAVDDYLSWRDTLEVVTRLNTAAEKSSSAWYLTYNGKKGDSEAIEIWRQIFGDRFPAYG